MGTLPATTLVLLGGDLRLAPSAACLRSSCRLGALVRESLHPTGLLMATAIVAGLVWVP